jgi:tetratricopeptide (TPR) repeat protein
MRREAAPLVLLLALAITSARAAPDPAGADEAFDAGDNARALALYDEILAADPNDVHALVRSGKLLSWDRRFSEALARYDRALTREPSNGEALLERGKVLLWSRRYDEAIPAFARVLRTKPDEPWALCGTAQAYAWSGRGRQARPYYERALAAQPDMKEALLGLAYLDLDDGDTATALTRSRTLSASHPDDPEVADLAHQVRKARAPWIQIGWDNADDSDENSMNTYRAEGGLALPSRTDLRAGYAHSDLSGPVPATPHASGSADALYGVLGFQPRAGQRGELRLGATRLTDSSGDDRTVAVGGLSYAFPLADWTGRASISHDPFLYSPQILDNAIDVTSIAFGAYGMASSRVRIEANAGYGDFSDGNGRINADAGAWYVLKWPRRFLWLGGGVRTLDYTKDLDNGYFDPSSLLAGVLSLRSEGAIAASLWRYEAAAEGGVQSYTLHGAQASGKPLWNLSGLVARPLPHGVSFQVYAGFGNSSTASGPGFTSHTVGVRLRFTIGG